MSHRTNPSDETQAQRLVSRRSVVKAGVHAAWTVPLVQVATQTSALAAVTSGPAALTVSGSGSWSGSGSNATLPLSITVRNTGGQATTALQVTLTMPWAHSATSPSGWTVTTSGTTSVFTASAQLAAGQAVTFNPTIKPSSSNNAGRAASIPVSATPGGSGKPGATTITVSGK